MSTQKIFIQVKSKKRLRHFTIHHLESSRNDIVVRVRAEVHGFPFNLRERMNRWGKVGGMGGKPGSRRK